MLLLVLYISLFNKLPYLGQAEGGAHFIAAVRRKEAGYPVAAEVAISVATGRGVDLGVGKERPAHTLQVADAELV
jgi:hypothetical protein